MSGTTLCPRCGAPIPWDGTAKTVDCPYCRIVVTPSQFGAPPRNVPAMRTPSAAGAMGAGCVIAIVITLVVTLAGAGAAIFLLRSTSTGVSVITTSPPMVTTPPFATATAAPSALLTFGTPGNGAGQLSDARSIAVDMDENVYTADYDTLRVQKFDATGKFVWIVQVSKDEFAGNKQIWQLAVDSKKVLWVSRTGALIKLDTSDGKTLGTLKGNYDNLWYKWVALDPVGNIATAHDAAGDTDLLLLDANGKLKKRVKNKTIDGLAFDGAGNVYMSGGMDGDIEVLDAQGNVKSKFGSKSDPHLGYVKMLAIDGKNHIFASTNEGINVFDLGGAFIKTIDKGSARDFAVSTKGNLFKLDKDQVTKIDIGSLP